MHVCSGALQVRHISRDDFTVEVNDASKEAWVVVLLYKDGVPNSKYLEAFIPRVSGGHSGGGGTGSGRRQREEPGACAARACRQNALGKGAKACAWCQPVAPRPCSRSSLACVQLAAAHKATKFVRIVADQCIPGFKDE